MVFSDLSSRSTDHHDRALCLCLLKHYRRLFGDEKTLQACDEVGDCQGSVVTTPYTKQIVIRRGLRWCKTFNLGDGHFMHGTLLSLCSIPIGFLNFFLPWPLPRIRRQYLRNNQITGAVNFAAFAEFRKPHQHSGLIEPRRMRLLLLFSILVTQLASTVAQETNITILAQEIASLSPCGVSTPYQWLYSNKLYDWPGPKLICLETNIPTVGCSLLNTTCQCSSKELVTLTAKCLMKNCTFLESLGTSSHGPQKSTRFLTLES